MSPDDSDEHHVTRSRGQTRRKGKSKLANDGFSEWSGDSEDDGPGRRNSARRSSMASRRRMSRSSRTLDVGLNNHDGSHFEGRFNASGLDPAAAGISFSDDSHTSSSKATMDDEDEEEPEEDDDVHDAKGNPLDNSPYAQVRASVAATDNILLSIDTPRMWSLSILFAMAGSSTNLFFSLRYPSVSLTPIIALLLVHPLGLLWDQLLKRSDDPDETFVNGCLQKTTYSSSMSPYKSCWKRRLRLWLAQGRWNEKEHCCVYVSSNVSFGFAFATDVRTEAYVDLGLH